MAWAESSKRTSARITGGDVQYEEYSTTNLYVERVFTSSITQLTITNDDSAQNIQFSFDGASLDGELLPNETISVSTTPKTSIFIKSDSGGSSVRYWAW